MAIRATRKESWHALLEGSATNVDENGALFMSGACGAFVSYLINKARSADLLAK
jgi:hypothetical protein